VPPWVPWVPSPTSCGVPSYDSTGKRLSGGAQRRRAQEHAAQRGGAAAKPAAAPAPAQPPRAAKARAADAGDTDADAPHPIPFGAPPVGEGVEAGVEWTACLQAQVAVLAAYRRDPPRVRALGVVTKAVSTARSAAQDSERAVRLSQAYLAQTIDTTGEAPPTEPAGIVLWAFARLLQLAHLTATQEGSVDEAQVAHQARALALCAQVQPQHNINQLTKAAEAAALAATVPTLRSVG